jgi:hypothetical protein
MDRIVNIQNIDPATLELQTYSSEDQSLISSFELENSFTSSVDYIEYTVYDFNQNLLLYIDRLSNYLIINNQIQIDPEADLLAYGFDEGQYIANYSFFKNILGSSNDNTYYISEISSDRTEVRLDTTLIDNNFVISSTNEFATQLQQANYYKDFYLNFGNNNLVIANNVLLDTSDPNNPGRAIDISKAGLKILFEVMINFFQTGYSNGAIKYKDSIVIINMLKETDDALNHNN